MGVQYKNSQTRMLSSRRRQWFFHERNLADKLQRNKINPETIEETRSNSAGSFEWGQSLPKKCDG